MLDGGHKYFYKWFHPFLPTSPQTSRQGNGVQEFSWWLLSQTGQATGHLEDLPLCPPHRPGKDFLQTAASPSSPAGPCLESPHQKGLPSHPTSKSRPPTPALGHSLSLTLLGFSSKFSAQITYWYNFSVSFCDSVRSKRIGVFDSFVLCYSPDIWLIIGAY